MRCYLRIFYRYTKVSLLVLYVQSVHCVRYPPFLAITRTIVPIMAGLDGYGVGTKSGGNDMVEVDGGDFNYNDKILVETSMNRFFDFSIRPIGALTHTTPKSVIRFNIDPMIDKYLQFNKTRLEMKLRVIKENGARLSPMFDCVGVSNFLGVLMWQSVVPKLNGQPFPGAGNVNSGLKAVLDSLLSTEDASRHTHAQTQVLHMDEPERYEDFSMTLEQYVQGVIYELEHGGVTPIPDGIVALRQVPHVGQADLTDAQRADCYNFPFNGNGNINGRLYVKSTALKQFIEAEALREGGPNESVITTFGKLYEVGKPPMFRNRGFRERERLVRGSEEFIVVAPIPHDFFNLNNNIGPGNRIDIELTPYDDALLLNTLNGRERYRLDIMDIRMHLRAIERKERIQPPLVERYRMNLTELHKETVNAGTRLHHFRVSYGEIQPKTIIFAFNDTRAIEGDYGRNPINFSHFGLKKIYLNLDGERYPTNPLIFDFNKTNPDCIWGYHWLFENTGCLMTNRGNLITLNQFMTGAFLIVFDLTPDKCNGVHNHKGQYGFIEAEFEWDAPLQNSITILYERVFNKLVVNNKLTSQLAVVDVDA